jgi:hypothetical protein
MGALQILDEAFAVAMRQPDMQTGDGRIINSYGARQVSSNQIFAWPEPIMAELAAILSDHHQYAARSGHFCRLST